VGEGIISMGVAAATPDFGAAVPSGTAPGFGEGDLLMRRTSLIVVGLIALVGVALATVTLPSATYSYGPVNPSTHCAPGECACLQTSPCNSGEGHPTASATIRFVSMGTGRAKIDINTSEAQPCAGQGGRNFTVNIETRTWNGSSWTSWANVFRTPQTSGGSYFGYPSTTSGQQAMYNALDTSKMQYRITLDSYWHICASGSNCVWQPFVVTTIEHDGTCTPDTWTQNP